MFSTAIATKTAAPQTSEDPFEARFGHALPRGLREEAAGMTWRDFLETYSPAVDMRIQFIDIQKLRGNYTRFVAQFTQRTESGRQSIAREIVASGPVNACSNLLADAGFPIEIHSFHQFDIFEATVTFIYGGTAKNQHWAMGFGGNREQSACTALAAAATLLYKK